MPLISKKLSAQERRLGEQILDEAAPARRLMRPETVQKLKGELERLSAADRPLHVRALARKMYADHPELAS